ncbi:MAG: pyrroline-5-carboxylate reductase [Lachnospiraceae bacterium]|nr:pyrroline-5-carboxylate reductase [Lachnospiraceae bacterium]
MKLGFIGCGNMASAMIGGIIAKGLYKAEDIIVSDALEASLQKARTELKVNTTSDNKEVVAKAEIIVLSVKPQFYEEVIEEINKEVKEEQLVITIAPGKTLKWLDETFGKPMKLIRCMPNTPALVGEGITGVCANENVTEEELNKAGEILNCFGSYEVVPEHLMDVVVSVSGSAPAYVFMFIEAMADAAVSDGMPRAQAYKFAAQAVLGSAKMVLETGKHPGELKDMVCSPAGTTIEAVRVLEEKGFRSSVIEAMKACAEKSRSL